MCSLALYMYERIHIPTNSSRISRNLPDFGCLPASKNGGKLFALKLKDPAPRPSGLMAVENAAKQRNMEGVLDR